MGVFITGTVGDQGGERLRARGVRKNPVFGVVCTESRCWRPQRALVPSALRHKFAVCILLSDYVQMNRNRPQSDQHENERVLACTLCINGVGKQAPDALHWACEDFIREIVQVMNFAV